MWQHHRLFFFNPKLIYFLVYRLRGCQSSSSVCSRRKDLFKRISHLVKPDKTSNSVAEAKISLRTSRTES